MCIHSTSSVPVINLLLTHSLVVCCCCGRRLCHLIDRMQASSTDSRTAASHLVSQSLNTTSTGLQHTTAHGTSGSGISPATSGSSTGLSGDFVLLSHQAYAVADPLSAVGGISRGLSSSKSNTASNTSSSSSGWAKWRPQHIEGGLFLSSALMGSAAATKQGSWTPGGVSRSASPAAGAAAGLLEVSPVGRVVPAGGSGALAGSGWIGIGAGAAESSQQQAGLLDLHRKSSGVTYSYSGAQHSPGSSGPGAAVSAVSSGVKHGHTAGGLSSISEQQQQQGMGVRVSRSVLVVWLRAALDVLAALTHVDPAAVLMELSHKLAGESTHRTGTPLVHTVPSFSCTWRGPLVPPRRRESMVEHCASDPALVSAYSMWRLLCCSCLALHHMLSYRAQPLVLNTSLSHAFHQSPLSRLALLLCLHHYPVPSRPAPLQPLVLSPQAPA